MEARIIGSVFMVMLLMWIRHNHTLHKGFQAAWKRPLQNWHIWHISSLCVARKTRLTNCYVFVFCATTPWTVPYLPVLQGSLKGYIVKQLHNWNALHASCRIIYTLCVLFWSCLIMFILSQAFRLVCFCSKSTTIKSLKNACKKCRDDFFRQAEPQLS